VTWLRYTLAAFVVMVAVGYALTEEVRACRFEGSVG
jgi:uncharacterized membrane protein